MYWSNETIIHGIELLADAYPRIYFNIIMDVVAEVVLETIAQCDIQGMVLHSWSE